MIYEPYSANYRFALPNGFFQIVAAGLPLVRAALPEIEAAIGRQPVGVALERLDPPTLAAAILRCAEDTRCCVACSRGAGARAALGVRESTLRAYWPCR